MSSLSLFVSDKNLILDFHETLRLIDKSILSKLNSECFDREKLLHLSSLKSLKSLFFEDLNSIIDRIYFGIETCEKKIPSLASTQDVYQIAEKNKMHFTYVTPYVGYRAIEKLNSTLFFLNKLYKNIEVVINDWGVLNIIERKYNNLVPVIGRLLLKMKRDPRYSLTPYYKRYNFDEEPVPNADDTVMRSKIKKYLGDSSFSIPIFQKFLKNKNFSRISLDLIPSDLYINSIFPLDVYWPWTYITSGRGLRQCYGVNHTLNRCIMSCRNEYYEIEGNSFNTFLKGNAIWMYTPIEFLKKYITDKKNNTISSVPPVSPNNVYFDRIIYQPYIPA